MILLDTTTKKLQIVMGGAITTTAPDYVAHYTDITSSAFTPGNSNGVLNGTTAVDVVAAPDSSTYRQIKALSITNLDSVTNTFTIRYNDNGTVRKVGVFSLATGYSLHFEDADGWYVLDINGGRVVGTASINLTGGTGIVAQTGSGTYSARTITGTTNEVSVSNGDGVSGNPTLSLPSTVELTGKTINVQDSTFSIKDNADATKIIKFEASTIATGTTRTVTIPNSSGTLCYDIGSANIVTVGTITSGTWQGTNLDYTRVANRPSFSAVGTTQVINNATATLLAFSTVEFDTLSNYTNTAANYKFTAPTTGKYFFNGRVSLAPGSGSNSEIRLYKNGVQLKAANYNITATIASLVITIQTTLSLTAADTIQIYFYQDSGGTKTVTLQDFSGYWL